MNECPLMLIYMLIYAPSPKRIPLDVCWFHLIFILVTASIYILARFIVSKMRHRTDITDQHFCCRLFYLLIEVDIYLRVLRKIYMTLKRTSTFRKRER